MEFVLTVFVLVVSAFDLLVSAASAPDSLVVRSAEPFASAVAALTVTLSTPRGCTAIIRLSSSKVVRDESKSS